MKTLAVVDTSYLCEWMRVPDFTDERDAEEIEKRFAAAARDGWSFYLPLPCLFELADHITDCGHAGQRLKLAKKLRDQLTASLKNEGPWILWPAPRPDEDLTEIFDQWVDGNVVQRVGITDTATARTAVSLGKRYQGLGYKVHIWTKDDRLKALEPDREDNAFCGF